ncbi:hypothetical protein [Streptomyces bullii]|uniref:Helicase associated domain-containing protein n=1 Tax=Streptomyces bullii TaxID=349910 RepID=A0ABW0V219_9ACTN
MRRRRPEHQHKLGVWISNFKTRRGLTHDQRTAHAGLGIDRA